MVKRPKAPELPTVVYVMRTLDRRPATNYLGDTLAAWSRSHSTGTPPELHLIDSGGSADLQGFIVDALNTAGAPAPRHFHPAPDNVRLTNNQNALRALQIGHRAAPLADYLVHLEDDIDVCRDLDGSIRRWLRDYGGVASALYTFHTPYRQVRQRFLAGESIWEYPIRAFYGNQCWAMPMDLVPSAIRFLEKTIPTWNSGQGFDLLLKRWAQETWKGHEHFLASCPSFVQHVGEQSSLHPGRFHQNGSWPGRQWTYTGETDA